MTATFGDPEVRHDEDVMLDDGVDELVAHLAVANQVGEAIDPRCHEVFGVLVIEDVGDDIETLTMGLIDDGSVIVRVEFFNRTATIYSTSRPT